MHTTPVPGSWIMVQGRRKRLVGFYRGHWVLYDARWELITPAEWHYATKEERYFGGTMVQLEHEDFPALVSTLSAYSGALAHYVWLESYNWDRVFFDLRSKKRRMLKLLGMSTLGILGEGRGRQRAADFEEVDTLAQSLVAIDLLTVEETMLVWRSRRDRIDQNTSPDYRTLDFPDVSVWDQIVEGAESCTPS